MLLATYAELGGMAYSPRRKSEDNRKPVQPVSAEDEERLRERQAFLAWLGGLSVVPSLEISTASIPDCDPYDDICLERALQKMMRSNPVTFRGFYVEQVYEEGTKSELQAEIEKATQEDADAAEKKYSQVVLNRPVYVTVNVTETLTSPLESLTVTEPIGTRDHPIFYYEHVHPGVDYAAGLSDPVFAATAGQVVFAGWLRGYGNAVIIRSSTGLQTLYAHMSSLLVSEGEEVSQGVKVGKAGKTGTATGVHLHFEVYVLDQDNRKIYLDPADLMRR